VKTDGESPGRGTIASRGGPAFRPVVERAAAGVAEARQKMAARHHRGTPGTQVCNLGSDLFEAVVLDVYHTILEGLEPAARRFVERRVSLVAHGGFGRREMAPYSDVDLMLLHERDTLGVVPPLARRLLQDLFDAGLDVGQSVRTVAAATRLAAEDATVFSSLVDSRLLAGPPTLLEQLEARLGRLMARRRGQLLAALLEARGEERHRYGGSVALLEPNVKRSPGGLRDIQLVRWIGLLGWGASSLRNLVLLDAIPGADVGVLRDAADFLLGVRVDLHLAAGKANDELTRDEQARIAGSFGIGSRGGLLGVERFMREYCGVTRSVMRIAEGIARRAGPSSSRRGLVALLGHVVEEHFRIGPWTVSVRPRARSRVAESLPLALRLLELSMHYDRPVDHDSWAAVRSHFEHDDEDGSGQRPEVDAACRARFLGLFERPTRLGESLRLLHRARLLERFVPPFDHARGLLQFNNYHKFTVDEHCIQAVERGVELADDPGWLGGLAREIRRHRPLLLALLLHDLGKGHAGDHSEVGAVLAADVCRRLGLGEEEAEIVVFLVEKHLLMSHVAFRRNVGDPSVVVGFAREVGSPEVLRMLTVLTAADVAAVGPGTWTGWKSDLLADLYFRTLGCLDGESPSLPAERHRAELEDLLVRGGASDGMLRLFRHLPHSYLHATEPQHMLEELDRLATLPPEGLFVSTRWHPDTATIGITIGARDDVAPGLFHRITAGLASLRLSVLSADIHTLPGGLVLDHFIAQDPDQSGEPPPFRTAEVEECLRRVIAAGSLPTIPALIDADAPSRALADRLPPRVRIDNESSETTTIIEVFAHDSPGLLSAVATAFLELGLSVWAAKIGTYLDQVVDAFHVTEADGSKLTSPQRLRVVRQALEEVLQRHRGG